MTRTVFCEKLKIESEGLEEKTYPGELGDKIYNHISKAGWKLWIDLQTRLINEYRLNLLEPKAKQFLKEQMETFLFEDEEKKQ